MNGNEDSDTNVDTNTNAYSDYDAGSIAYALLCFTNSQRHTKNYWLLNIWLKLIWQKMHLLYLPYKDCQIFLNRNLMSCFSLYIYIPMCQFHQHILYQETNSNTLLSICNTLGELKLEVWVNSAVMHQRNTDGMAVVCTLIRLPLKEHNICSNLTV